MLASLLMHIYCKAGGEEEGTNFVDGEEENGDREEEAREIESYIYDFVVLV